MNPTPNNDEPIIQLDQFLKLHGLVGTGGQATTPDEYLYGQDAATIAAAAETVQN